MEDRAMAHDEVFLCANLSPPHFGGQKGVRRNSYHPPLNRCRHLLSSEPKRPSWDAGLAPRPGRRIPLR